MSQKSDNDREQLRLEYLFDRGISIKDRVVQITGHIEEGSFDFIDAALTELERGSRKAITVRINSPGGSVYEALAMAGRLQSSKCQIITEGYGHIMSAAILILAAGDKRRMSRLAWAMNHEASYTIGGRHSDVKDEIAQMEREERMWCDTMAEMSNADADFWYNTSHKKNFYLDASECKNLGLIDEIL